MQVPQLHQTQAPVIWAQSHTYTALYVEKKDTKCQFFSARPVHNLKQYIYIILYEKARASPCHFVDRELKYSAKILA